MTRTDLELLDTGAPLFDELYDYHRQAILLGHEPS